VLFTEVCEGWGVPCQPPDDSLRKSPISQHVSVQLWIFLPARAVGEVQILLASRVSRGPLLIAWLIQTVF